MLNDHYEELATQRQLHKRPDPDWGFYIDEQSKGRLIFIAARQLDAHNLVGYMGMLLRTNPHYKSIGLAVGDLHYLMPSYRGLGVGKDMIAFAEKVSAMCGAQMFVLREKYDKGVDRERHAHIYKSLGYELTDLVYTKDISNVETPVG